MTLSLATSFCLSVCPHRVVRLPPEGFFLMKFHTWDSSSNLSTHSDFGWSRTKRKANTSHEGLSTRVISHRVFFFSVALRPNAGEGLLILEVSRSHTTAYHSRQDSSGRVISSSQRPLPNNTQHSQETFTPPPPPGDLSHPLIQGGGPGPRRRSGRRRGPRAPRRGGFI